MHVHIGALNLMTAFLGVILIGTLWRLAAAHLASSSSPALAQAGKAMAFQY